MIDREYVKLNTSIQTGSNSSTLLYDDEGNIEASLELRLPDNLFAGNRGPKKIDKVEMQTSKFRLSMENTPIAALPITPESSVNDVISECQLDVYPWVRTGVNEVTKMSPSSLPYYKEHTVKLMFYLHETPRLDQGAHLIDIVTVHTNINGKLDLPEDDRYNPIVEKYIEPECSHMLNLRSTLGPFKYENNKLQIRDIDLLARFLQDAFENALTFASTTSAITCKVHLVTEIVVNNNQLTPEPKTDIWCNVPQKACLWTFEFDKNASQNSCHLISAFKPMVRFSEQSITISYDTAPFDEIIPILWNPSFIDSKSYPPQMSLDDLREYVWKEPPPKRIYKYGVNLDPDTRTFSYTLPDDMTCAVMNLIANKAFKDTFSFLPWIPITQNAVMKNMEGVIYSIHKYELVNISTMPETDVVLANMFSGGVPKLGIRVEFYSGDERVLEDEHQKCITYTYKVEWSNPTMRIEQSTNFGTSQGQGASSNIIAPTYTSTHGDVETQTSTRDHGTTTSTISPLKEKTGTLQLYTTTSNEVLDSTYTDDGNFAATFLLYNEFPNADGTPNWQIGDDRRLGTWVSGTQDKFKWLPPRIYDKQTMEVHIDGVNSYTIYTEYWYFPIGRDEYDPYIAVATSSWKYLHEYTRRKYEHVMMEDVSEIQGDPLDVALIPNLSMGNDEHFYILDGTGCEISIGEPEPIYDRYGTFKGRTKITKTSTITDRYNQTVTDSLCLIHTSAIKGESYVGKRILRAEPNLISKNVVSDAAGRKYPYVRYEYDERNGVRSNEVCWVKDSVGDGLWITWDNDFYGKIYEGSELFEEFANFGTSAVSTPEPLPIYESLKTTTTVEYTNEELTPGTSTETETEWRFKNTPTYTETAGYTECSVGFDLYIIPPDSTVPDLLSFKTVWFEPMTAPKYTEDQNYVGRYNFKPPDDFQPFRVIEEQSSETTKHICKDYLIVAEDIVNSIGIGLSLEVVSIDLLNLDITFAPYTYYVIMGAMYNRQSKKEFTEKSVTTVIEREPPASIKGNVRLTYTWNNLPIVTISPIQSIVLTLTGIQINQEYQPVNIAEKEGSSLTSTIPVVENYYSLAETLRDLHDELVVTKESFDDTATYTLSATSGQERVLHFSAKYIAKDGSLHQIYIPPNGVFSIQLTFGISYYIS